jgi:ElaB/YqjD/DUF883 family membrane-anchored ribosome-binding protein
LTTLKTLTEKASELGKEAKESVEELGRSAGDRLEKARYKTGDALHAAASSVRTTADRLDATAAHIEGHGLQKIALRHPKLSLAAAVAVGFFAKFFVGQTVRLVRKCV